MGAIPQIRKKLQSPLGKTRQRNQVHPLVPHCFYCSRRFVRRSFPSLSIVPRLHQDPLFFRPLCCYVIAALPATVCLASAWHPSFPSFSSLSRVPGSPAGLLLLCSLSRDCIETLFSFVHYPAMSWHPSLPLCASRQRGIILPILFFPFSGALRFACRSLPPLFIVPRLHRGTSSPSRVPDGLSVETIKKGLAVAKPQLSMLRLSKHYDELHSTIAEQSKQ